MVVQSIRKRITVLLFLSGITLQAFADEHQESIDRGEYLAIAADCAGCHTRDGGDDYAGGLAINSPLGTLYSANITSDPDSGIGEWTLQDFSRALRLGRDDEGQYIYPAMPYEAYTQISDVDIADLWAYISSLPAVSYDPPANDMIFPANIRAGLAFWQAIEFIPGRFVADPEKDDVYNRGAYLVEALGHCSSCHTPRDLLFGEKENERFTGAEIHGWYAPAIGPGVLSDIGDWSVDELARFLATGTNDTNQKAVGEMSNVIHLSLSRMTDEDVLAMATYLKNMPVASEAVGKDDERALSETANPRLNAGRALYAQQCLGCHQADGRGIEGGVPSLVDNGAVTGAKPDNLVMLMLQGHAPEGTWGVMPSFAASISARDIADIANFVRTAWGNEGRADVTVDKVHELRTLAQLPADGQQAAIDCPVLSGASMAPTLDMTLSDFEQAQSSAAAADQLVLRYLNALPDSDDNKLSEPHNVVLALSSAYCRFLADVDEASHAEQLGQVAALSGRIASVAMKAVSTR